MTIVEDTRVVTGGADTCPDARGNGITGGVDTHADTHVAAALDPIGGLLGVREFPASAAGYAALLGWLRMIRRYKGIMKRISADPAAATYTDEALQPATRAGELDHFVEMYADKIPKTYGAPTREAHPAAAVAAEAAE